MPTLLQALPLCVFASAAAQSTTWEVVGAPGISDGAGICCQIAIASDGAPVIAFQDQSTPAIRCSVMQYRAGAWSHLGARGSASNGQAWYNRIALDAADRVYLGCRDYAVGGRISVRTFDPATNLWSSVGPGGLSLGEAHYTDVAIGPDGLPVVVFADRTTTPVDRSTALRFTNSGWQVLGGLGFSPAGAGYTSLEVDGAGAVFAAFTDASQPDAATQIGRASVLRHDASTGAWTPVGASGFTPHGALNVTLALDRTGLPWVAYYVWHAQIVVMRFDGASWARVGGSASGSELPDVQTESWRQWLSLDFDSQNTPYVAYQSYAQGNRASVRRFDGASWVPVGNLRFSAGAADYLSMAIGPDDVPYVVFRDATAAQRITVMRHAPSPHAYCTAVVNSLGCTPAIAASGVPSLSGADPIRITATNIPTHRSGLLLFSTGGDRAPFHGGHLCVRAPFRRGGTAHSGAGSGAADCSGVLEGDLGPFLRASTSTWQPGQRVFAQFYYRDFQSAAGVGLTNGVRFELVP